MSWYGVRSSQQFSVCVTDVTADDPRIVVHGCMM
jgi:hypothetical protein